MFTRHFLSKSHLPQKCFGSIFSQYSTSSSLPIGFIGLGNMGGFMAANLAKNGHPIFAFDVSQESRDKLASQVGKDQVVFVKSPSDITKSAQHIITMLPSSPQVEQVYLDENNGLLSSNSRITKGMLLLDCTTGEPQVCQKVSQLATAKGANYLDAPVSGGVVAAQNAALTFMVGGSNHLVAEAEPILKKMGKTVIHCGEMIGSGQAAKICNNMLLAISMIGTSEAMALGQRLGLDPKVLASVLNSSSGRCWSSELYNPVPGIVPTVPCNRDYNGGFGAALMLKDLGLAMSAAQQSQTCSPLGAAAHHLYRLLVNQGFANKDFSVVYKFLNPK